MVWSIAVFFSILKKAFDSLDHQIPVRNLECYGVRAVPYSWFRSYLCDRYQSVFVNTILSESLRVDYGMQQGSILVPLLFLKNINNMPSVVERSQIFLFADDTNVVYQDILNDVLQRDLNAIQNWLMNNKLTVNVQKSVLVDFIKKSASRCCIEPNGETLMSQSSCKYLWVF